MGIKRWYALLLAVLILASSGTAHARSRTPPAKIRTSHSSSHKRPIATSPIPAGWPKIVTIPRLGITAAIEDTPLVRPQDFEAPFSWSDTAWFSRGPKPGDPGHALIFGHLDSYCCPAIFWHLNDLRSGDVVYVRYRTGKPLKFRVWWNHSYWESPTLVKWVVYHKTKDRALLLITCAGVFHGTEAGYDHREVVYATLDLPSHPAAKRSNSKSQSTKKKH